MATSCSYAASIDRARNMPAPRDGGSGMDRRTTIRPSRTCWPGRSTRCVSLLMRTAGSASTASTHNIPAPPTSTRWWIMSIDSIPTASSPSPICISARLAPPFPMGRFRWRIAITPMPSGPRSPPPSRTITRFSSTCSMNPIQTAIRTQPRPGVAFSTEAPVRG